MSERLRKSLTYSTLATVVATVIMYFWPSQMVLPLFALLFFLIMFTLAYWRLFSDL